MLDDIVAFEEDELLMAEWFAQMDEYERAGLKEPDARPAKAKGTK